MRKRTIRNCCDEIFWYLLYFLPIIIAILSVFAYSGDWFSTWGEVANGYESIPFLYSLELILNKFGFYDGLIYGILLDIFGENGILGFVVGDSPILLYFQYFVTVYLTHLCIDFIIFIPRLAHKWLNKFTQGD